MNKEQFRSKLSSILMDTDEQHQLECDIVLGDEEAQGQSTLELPVIKSMFQLPSEGIIYFQIEGMEEPIEFDDLF